MLRYDGSTVPVFSGFDLELHKGEIVSILGASGVGKSSLLRVLGGLLPPSEGTVLVGQRRIDGVDPRVAFAFQDPSLLPWLTLERNVAFGLDFKRQPKLPANEFKDRVDAAIAEVGLTHARRQYPSELSGGMAQRAALARCLARRPNVLLLDEPFGALDEVTRAGMQRLLLKVVSDVGSAAVLVTHDIDEALLVSDRIRLLGGAPAQQIGEWSIGLRKPRDEFVVELGALRVEILKTLKSAALRQH